MKDRCLEFYIKYGERETRYDISYEDLWLDGYITWDARDYSRLTPKALEIIKGNTDETKT